MQAVHYQPAYLAAKKKPQPPARFAECGRLIKEALGGDSQLDAAGWLGVSPSYVFRLVGGHQRPSPALIDRIAKHYGADRAALLRAAGHTPPPQEVHEPRLTYETASPAVDVRQLDGLKDIPAEDAAGMNAALEAWAAEVRRRQGRG